MKKNLNFKESEKPPKSIRIKDLIVFLKATLKKHGNLQVLRYDSMSYYYGATRPRVLSGRPHYRSLVPDSAMTKVVSMDGRTSPAFKPEYQPIIERRRRRKFVGL